jgi:hypothetical protein
MNQEKFIIEYIPAAKLTHLSKEQLLEMSIDDFAEFQECFERKTQKQAEEKAKELYPLDFYGVVRLSQELFNEGDEDDPPGWETHLQTEYFGTTFDWAVW